MKNKIALSIALALAMMSENKAMDQENQPLVQQLLFQGAIYINLSHIQTREPSALELAYSLPLLTHNQTGSEDALAQDLVNQVHG
jgi:hypothetical protein